MTDIEGFLTIYGHSDSLLNNNSIYLVESRYPCYGHFILAQAEACALFSYVKTPFLRALQKYTNVSGGLLEV